MSSITEDCVLVERARSGDQGAFDELTTRYYRDIYLTVYSRMSSREDAADITQDVFLKALTSLHQLRSPHRFKQWLRRVAINTCVDHVKSRSRLSVLLELYMSDEELSLLHVIPAEEYHGPLVEAIQELSDINQRAILMHYFDDLSYAEIADRLRLSESTVRSRLFEARKQLREHLKPVAPPVLKERYSREGGVPSHWLLRRPAAQEDPRKYQVVDVDECSALRLVEYREHSANIWTPVSVDEFALSVYVKATQPDASWCISTHSRMSRTDFNEFGFEPFCLTYNGRGFVLSVGRENHACPPHTVVANDKLSIEENGRFHHYLVTRSGGRIEVQRDGILLVSAPDHAPTQTIGALQLGGTGHFQGDGVGAFFDGLVIRHI